MPCSPNDLGTIAPFTRVSVAQAFLFTLRTEGPVPQDATCEEPRRRGSAGVVGLEFDVWNVRFEFARIPKGKERNRAPAKHWQSCCVVTLAQAGVPVLPRSNHRPRKSISAVTCVATGFPSTSVAGLKFQRFTALIAS